MGVGKENNKCMLDATHSEIVDTGCGENTEQRKMRH